MSSVLLLFAAVAWHMSVAPAQSESGRRAPITLSGRSSSSGPAREDGDRLALQSPGLEDEISSMTNTLGKDLESELQGVIKSPTAAQHPLFAISGAVHSGPPFALHGKKGHYVECGDSIADGAVGEGVNGDLDKVQRFHGKVVNPPIPRFFCNFSQEAHVYLQTGW